MQNLRLLASAEVAQGNITRALANVPSSEVRPRGDDAIVHEGALVTRLLQTASHHLDEIVNNPRDSSDTAAANALSAAERAYALCDHALIKRVRNSLNDVVVVSCSRHINPNNASKLTEKINAAFGFTVEDTDLLSRLHNAKKRYMMSSAHHRSSLNAHRVVPEHRASSVPEHRAPSWPEHRAPSVASASSAWATTTTKVMEATQVPVTRRLIRNGCIQTYGMQRMRRDCSRLALGRSLAQDVAASILVGQLIWMVLTGAQSVGCSTLSPCMCAGVVVVSSSNTSGCWNPTPSSCLHVKASSMPPGAMREVF